MYVFVSNIHDRANNRSSASFWSTGQQYIFGREYVALTDSCRSVLMGTSDIRPPQGSAVSGKISAYGLHNRLGAVYAALHHFWTARQAISGSQRDANTVILYSEHPQTVCLRDTRRSPDELLDLLLPRAPKGSHKFNMALQTVVSGSITKELVRRHASHRHCLPFG